MRRGGAFPQDMVAETRNRKFFPHIPDCLLHEKEVAAMQVNRILQKECTCFRTRDTRTQKKLLKDNPPGASGLRNGNQTHCRRSCAGGSKQQNTGCSRAEAETKNPSCFACRRSCPGRYCRSCFSEPATESRDMVLDLTQYPLETDGCP